MNHKEMKIELLFGTTNSGKLNSMRDRLKNTNIQLIGLRDLNQEIPIAKEEGNSPLWNARQKAMTYYKTYQRPVFSCDSGLYMQGIPEELQPGVFVRRVNHKELTDEEMLLYYSNLAKEYGDIKAYFQTAICLVIDEEQIYEKMDDELKSEPFLLTARPHKKYVPGFPLDGISIDIKTGKYYYDLETSKNYDQYDAAFVRFFEEACADSFAKNR